MMDKQKEKQIKVFGFGLPLILAFLAWRHGARHGWDILSFCLLGLAAAVLVCTLFYRKGLEWLFKYWMKGAGAIGLLITTLLLGVIYFLVFTPVAFILCIKGKDFMQRHLDKGSVSYWIKREIKEGTHNKQY